MLASVNLLVFAVQLPLCPLPFSPRKTGRSLCAGYVLKQASTFHIHLHCKNAFLYMSSFFVAPMHKKPARSAPLSPLSTYIALFEGLLQNLESNATEHTHRTDHRVFPSCAIRSSSSINAVTADPRRASPDVTPQSTTNANATLNKRSNTSLDGVATAQSEARNNGSSKAFTRHGRTASGWERRRRRWRVSSRHRSN